MTVIHSAEFAQEGAALSGQIPLVEMPRLSDVLLDVAGDVAWQLTGGVDRYQRPCLRLKVQAEVKLQCQRCLESMPFVVDADTILTQFADEAHLDEAVEQEEDLEGILIDPELVVEVLVEDELLLALPYSPMHVNCKSALDKKDGGSGKPNPFAVLAQLRDQKS